VSFTHQLGNANLADPASRVTLMTGYNSPVPLHSVAGLRFAADGNSLFVGLGDGNSNGVISGQSLIAQDLDQLNGKILRIDPSTGLGLPSNPYYQAGAPGSVRSRVFAWGFRNPFRFTVDPTNGTLYVGDVGWNTWEMFQVFPLSTSNPVVERNAGWPCYEGGDGVALVQPDFASSPITGPTCHSIYTPAQGGTGPGALAPLYGYRHSDPGGTNGSAIVGGPRYTGTSNYPAGYNGKLFLGDYARSRMQVLDLSNGTATDFGTAGTWNSPVDVQIAPNGNVAYLSIFGAELDEIVFGGPVAKAGADSTATTGSSLIVHFSSAGSTGEGLTYSWDFGDGSAVSTAPNPIHTYATGAFTATLTVTDIHGGNDNASLLISVGALPTVSFAQPATGLKFKIGDTIPVQVSATDAFGTPITGNALHTQIFYWTGGHVYPVTEIYGSSGSFDTADQGFVNAYYQVVTTATDSNSLSTTVARLVMPKLARVSVVSSPPGITISVDGTNRRTPYSFSTIVGSQREVAAPATVTSGGTNFAQPSYSMAGHVTHGAFLAYIAPSTDLTIALTYVTVGTTSPGYWVADQAGRVSAFGGLASYGDLSGQRLAAPIVGIAATPDRRGYWLLGRDGGIFSFGDAAFHGSTGALRLNMPIVGMAPTPSGHGYWLVASDGGIFSFGDAAFHGSTGALRLNRPIVGMAPTPSGHGYWLVATDGGIFSFGDAAFHGSTGAVHLNKPIVGMARTPSGHGYWLVASDGGIFSFGDAGFYGSTGAIRLAAPIVAMASSPTGHGYRFVATDGGIFVFGDEKFFGSLGGIAGPPVIGLG
jgi:PKD repeat protein